MLAVENVVDAEGDSLVILQSLTTQCHQRINPRGSPRWQ